jgi:hypothetical protein
VQVCEYREKRKQGGSAAGGGGGGEDIPLPAEDDPERELRPYSSSDPPIISFAYSASSAEVGDAFPISEGGMSAAAAFLRCFDLLPPDLDRPPPALPPPAISMPFGAFGSIHSSVSSIERHAALSRLASCQTSERLSLSLSLSGVGTIYS